ncbi:MAG: isochorismatase family protein [Paracoccaceae bacterium]
MKTPAPALLVIDMQAEMQARLDAGRDCVNPEAGAALARLLAEWRGKGAPVFHIRHRVDDPRSPFAPGAPGFEAMPCAEAAPGEPVLVKTTSSAFASTPLEARLRAQGVKDVVIAGAVAGFCVNSTARAASDLGFAVTVAQDAVLGFDLPAEGLAARPLFDATMALLASGFARIASVDAVIAEQDA